VVLLALFIGSAALSRPTDIVLLLVPLFWGAGPRVLLRYPGQVILVAGVLACVALPQLVYWKVNTGTWLYDSYANPAEGLDLLTPHTLDVLFSFRKGWYIYTPIMLLATLGVFPLRTAWPAAFRSVLIFFLLNLYLVSSWTCWWYADSFSSRALVGSYAVMALPLAALVQWAGARTPRKQLVFALFVLLTAWNLFQYWQFTVGIIDPQRMTRAAYLASLFRVNRPEGIDQLLLVDRSHDALRRGPDPARYTVRILPSELTRIGPSDLDTFVVVPPSSLHLRAFLLTADHAFSPALRIPYKELLHRDHAWLTARWNVFIEDTAKVPGGCFVMTSEHGRSYSYQTTGLSDLDLSPGWNTLTTRYLTPEVRSLNDVFSVYYWSRDTVPVLVAGPELKVLEPIGAQ
jgi:hypothetical protein